MGREGERCGEIGEALDVEERGGGEFDGGEIGGGGGGCEVEVAEVSEFEEGEGLGVGVGGGQLAADLGERGGEEGGERRGRGGPEALD